MLISPFIDHRYLLGDVLGIGGTALVYEASDRHSGRELALKLLLPELANDPRASARLVEEARVARRIRHRNVVRVLDDGVAADGRPYVVMERAPGESLGALVRRQGALSLPRVRTIATQILDGVAAIHAAGFIHGDLKTDNIQIDSSRTGDGVMIIDFGLARPPATRPLFVEDDMLSGTPDYMAPELVRGGLAEQVADLYSVGIVVYEMVTGTTPFSGGSATMVLERHLSDPVVPPSLRCPDRLIPRAFESVLLRSLAKEPGRRHHDAATFAAALARSLQAAHDDAPARRPPAFSFEAPTRDWIRPGR